MASLLNSSRTLPWKKLAGEISFISMCQLLPLPTGAAASTTAAIAVAIVVVAAGRLVAICGTEDCFSGKANQYLPRARANPKVVAAATRVAGGTKCNVECVYLLVFAKGAQLP